MATNVSANLFLYTERDIVTELQSGGLNTANMRKFIGSYASLIRTQTDLPTAINEINVRIDGVDLRLDGIDSRLDGVDVRLDGIDSRLDLVDARLDDVEAVAYMALMT